MFPPDYELAILWLRGIAVFAGVVVVTLVCRAVCRNWVAAIRMTVLVLLAMLIVTAFWMTVASLSVILAGSNPRELFHP